MDSQTIFFRPILTQEQIMLYNFSMNQVYREIDAARSDFPNCKIEAVSCPENEHIIDDLDGRSMTFYVDIPKMPGEDVEETEFQNVETFKVREDAIAFAMEKFGADENGMIRLVSGY
jgi:hypothetical protein